MLPGVLLARFVFVWYGAYGALDLIGGLIPVHIGYYELALKGLAVLQLRGECLGIIM